MICLSYGMMQPVLSHYMPILLVQPVCLIYSKDAYSET